MRSGGADVGSPSSYAPNAPNQMDDLRRCLAAWPLELREDPRRGRFLVAARAVAAGEAVLRCAPPLLWALAPAWRKRACQGCGAVGRRRLEAACGRGCGAYFCSAVCRGARADAHAALCPLLAALGAAGLRPDVEAVMVAVAEALLLRRRGSDGGVAAARLAALQSHAADMDVAEAAAWAAAARRLLAAARRAGWPEADLPPEAELVAMASRVVSNNFGVAAPAVAEGAALPEEADDPEGPAAGGGEAAAGASPPPARQLPVRGSRPGNSCGRAVYYEASFINHACDPNCAAERDFAGAAVVALRPVAAGEEVTVSYRAAAPPQPLAARRAALRQQFWFECRCARCVDEEAGRRAPEARARWQEPKPGRAPKRRGAKARVSR